jgi:hypothetical protein
LKLNPKGRVIEEQPNVSCLSKIKIHKFKILGGILGVLVIAGLAVWVCLFGSIPGWTLDKNKIHTNSRLRYFGRPCGPLFGGVAASLHSFGLAREFSLSWNNARCQETDKLASGKKSLQ